MPKLVYAVWQARALRDQFADEARKAAKREKLELKEAQRKREEKQRAEEKAEEEELARMLEKVLTSWYCVVIGLRLVDGDDGCPEINLPRAHHVLS